MQVARKRICTQLHAFDGVNNLAKEAGLSIRIDAAVKAAIDKAAAEDRRSTASLVEKILADWAKANGYLKK